MAYLPLCCTRKKNPPYPVTEDVLVKLQSWRKFRKGRIFKRGTHHSRIKKIEGTALWKDVFKDTYWFKDSKGKEFQLSMTGLHDVKLLDGTHWDTEWHYYVPTRRREILPDGSKGPWEWKPVPEGCMTEEDMERKIEERRQGLIP